MPWEHCNNTVRDDDKCPNCGITKAQWTVEFNLTRTFRVKRKAKRPPVLRLQMLGLDDLPVPDEPFVVTLQDGTEQEAKLDEYGAAKLSVTGTCTIAFPELEPREVELVDGGEPLASAEGESFECGPQPAPHQFRLQDIALIRVTLVDSSEEPLANVDCRVMDLDDQEVFSGTTDDEGHLAHDGVALDDYMLVVGGDSTSGGSPAPETTLRISAVMEEEDWHHVTLPPMGYLRLQLLEDDDDLDQPMKQTPFRIEDLEGDSDEPKLEGETDDEGHIDLETPVELTDYLLVIGDPQGGFFARVAPVLSRDSDPTPIFVPPLGSLRAEVFDEDEAPRSGARFRVSTLEGREVWTGATDGEGRIQKDGVLLDEYLLEVDGETVRLPAVVSEDADPIPLFLEARTRRRRG